jgi:predicted DNA binding CopG/RHH family protein
MNKPRLKPLPKFRTEAEEARFWNRHDSTAYIDYDKAKPVVFPRLKPTTETISLRLPKAVLAHLRRLANRRDVPYQTLLKMFLAERIHAELRRERKLAG